MLPAVAMLATAGALAPMTPASANPGDAGVIVATGWVHLPAFPTDTLSGVPVIKTASASFCVAGAVTGPPPTVYAQVAVSLGGPTSCTGTPSPGPALTATISYNEPCPPGVGFAKGQLTLGSGTEYYFWFRIGLSAILLISDSPFSSPPTGAPSVAEILGSDGAAVAVFAPVPALSAPSIPPCPGPAVDAYVAAVGAWT
jgi:hypothetical protein